MEIDSNLLNLSHWVKVFFCSSFGFQATRGSAQALFLALSSGVTLGGLRALHVVLGSNLG